MSQNLFQVRGEIMHEFSVLEYLVRSYLAHLLATQQEQPLDTYKKQFSRFLEHIFSENLSEQDLIEFKRKHPEPHPKVLENPDVQRMDAELAVAQIDSINNCIEQLCTAAEKADFPKKEELCKLIDEIKEANRKRNTLTHSYWHEVGPQIVLQNFPVYYKRHWMYIKGDGERLTGKSSENWTLQELETFAAHVHELCERLENIFQG